MPPRASRPHMPDYGIETGRKGLLKWSWAEERLVQSHDYWVATVGAGARPAVMPVWGLWDGGALWFSSGGRSRRVRNLASNPECAITTDNPLEPVVLEGTAERVGNRRTIARFARLVNEKYDVSYDAGFYDPDVNACLRVQPSVVFAIDSANFRGSPTRFTMEGPRG